METRVRLGEIDSKASEALMDELRDRRTDAILSAKTCDETLTSCDDHSAVETVCAKGSKYRLRCTGDEGEGETEKIH